MKKSRKILLASVMALSLVGVGTATAFLVTGASTQTSGSADQAFVLSWGQSMQMGDVNSLAPKAPEFRSITALKPTMSASATSKEGVVTFTLAKTVDETDVDSIYDYRGLTIQISTTNWEDPDATADVGTLSVPLTIDEENPAVLEVTSEPISIDTTFYLKFEISQEAFDTIYAPRDEGTPILGADLTVSYIVQEKMSEQM